MLKKLISGILLLISVKIYAQEYKTFEYAWIQLGSEGEISARLITKKTSCPLITLDNKKKPMSLRGYYNHSFPVNVCEAIIPKTVKKVTVDNQVLVLPKKNPTRLVIVGDTGCRIKYSNIQNCSDPAKWPFAKIIQKADEFKPDLVIHLGDYYYRETPCLNNKNCLNSPYGNHWQTWKADFFQPTKPLLQHAPWVFVRGNHENCDRGGKGWFRFLANGPYHDKCEIHSPPFIIPLGNEQLFIMDSSAASDISILKSQVKFLKPDFELLNKQTKPTWLISHKPFWGVGLFQIKDIHLDKFFVTSLQRASNNEFKSNVKMILSGHVHLFQTLNIQGQPVQVIAGNGGSRLQTVNYSNLSGIKLNKMKVDSGINIVEFGYLTLEKSHHVWKGFMRNKEGKILAQCQLIDQKFICDKKNIENHTAKKG
ncbi:MAG: hypothetical protein LEGION0398_MBIBDBAK_00034 [Legionellaceae bacterium]